MTEIRQQPTENEHTKRLPFLMGLLAAFLFGLATPAGKVLLGEINPFLLAGLLYLGAALGVTPLILRESSTSAVLPRPSSHQLSFIIGAVFCGGFLGPVLLMMGLKIGQATSVAIWLNMELVATALLGVLLFHDNLDRDGWLGVILAFAAGLIITVTEDSGGLTAALLVTAACFCWGFDNHFTALIDCLTPARITFLKGVLAGTINTLLGLYLANDFPNITNCLQAIMLGTFSYGASIVLYVLSAQQLGATRSQVIFSSAPLFAIALAIFILDETLQPMHIAAILCLIAAMFFSNRDRHEHAHSHQETSHTHQHNHRDGHHTHTHGNEMDDTTHSHPHRHTPKSHSHPHYPDLHHRHDHE